MAIFLIARGNKFALTQANNHENTPVQNECLKEIALTGPVVDKEKDFRFWQEYVQCLNGCYVMKDAPTGSGR